MSSQRSAPQEVLLLDFWSDRNRGDAAMQIGLVQLLREQLPTCRLTVMTAFGVNQWPAFVAELDETGGIVDDVVSGFNLTFDPLGKARAGGRWGPRLQKAVGVAFAAILLPIWPLLNRLRWLDRALPRAARSSVRAMRSADLVIWNGRNFRSDLVRREPYDMWNLLYNPLVALACAKPVACIGASFWPLRSGLSRRLVRKVVSKAYFLSVREPASYAYASELLDGTQTTIQLLPDLSLAVLADGASHLASPRDSEQRDLRRVGVTIVDWPQLGACGRERYVEAVRRTLVHLLETNEAEVIVVPQVTYEMEQTGSLAEEILRDVDPRRFTVIHGRPTVTELVQIYASLDLLIATRMHSAIFALSQGTPVVTIPYDEGGKWGIIEMMGASDIDVPYAQITPNMLIQKVADVWERRLEILAAGQVAIPELRATVELNVSVPLEMYVGEAVQ